jgi:predicted nuclease with TOPRIM domain
VHGGSGLSERLNAPPSANMDRQAYEDQQLVLDELRLLWQERQEHIAALKRMDEEHAAQMKKMKEDLQREHDEVLERSRQQMKEVHSFMIAEELRAAAVERAKQYESQMEEELRPLRQKVALLKQKLAAVTSGRGSSSAAATAGGAVSAATQPPAAVSPQHVQLPVAAPTDEEEGK